MQLAVILAVLGLVNIVGVGAVSEHDLAQRGMDSAEYRATVDVEQVSPEERPNLLDAIRNKSSSY